MTKWEKTVRKCVTLEGLVSMLWILLYLPQKWA